LVLVTVTLKGVIMRYSFVKSIWTYCYNGVFSGNAHILFQAL